MAELIVVGFEDNMHRASEVLDELRVLDVDWVVELRDAVAVHREWDGSLKMDQSYQPTGREGAGWGGTLGLLIGATLAIPFTAGASAAVAAGAIAASGLAGAAIGATGGDLDASFWKDEFGIPQEFVTQVSSLIRPGSSAIYAIFESADTAVVAARFQDYGGTILQTTLNKSQQEQIETALHSTR